MFDFRLVFFLLLFLVALPNSAAWFDTARRSVLRGDSRQPWRRDVSRREAILKASQTHKDMIFVLLFYLFVYLCI